MHYPKVVNAYWCYFFFYLGLNEADIQVDDGSLWGDSDEELNKASDLDREWQRRHDQFHTVFDNLEFLFI